MICLNDTDVIEGGASVDAVVDYQIHGLVDSTFTQLAAGVMGTTLTTVLYTASAAVSVVAIVLVNKHTSVVNITLCLDPANGGNPRYLLPKTVSLGVGYSLHTDGTRFGVYNASGNLMESYALHAAEHTDGTDDIQSATNVQKGLATATHIAAIETNTAKTGVTTEISNVIEDTAPELGGQFQVHEFDIKLDSLLSADGKYSGITCDGVLGATLVFGDLVYLNTTDQRWELADADAEATAGDVQLAIVLAAGNDGDTKLLLLQGFIREDDWNFTSYGQALYVGLTAGDVVQSVDTYTTGDIVRVIGHASTFADQIYFNPSGSWVEIT